MSYILFCSRDRCARLMIKIHLELKVTWHYPFLKILLQYCVYVLSSASKVTKTVGSRIVYWFPDPEDAGIWIRTAVQWRLWAYGQNRGSFPMFQSQLDSIDISTARPQQSLSSSLWAICSESSFLAALFEASHRTEVSECSVCRGGQAPSWPATCPAHHPESNWKEQGVCAMPLSAVPESFTQYNAGTEQILCDSCLYSLHGEAKPY